MALILTMAITILFLILVAGFYQTIIGRHRWTHKRSAKTEGSYKAEAGMQDAVAKLRLGTRNPGSGIDPGAGLDYCLDVSNPGAACVAPPCSSPCDVHVQVAPRNPTSGLNRIDVTANY